MKFCPVSFIALILAATVLIPGAGAGNQTMDTIYLLTHAETLATQKDMSQYSNTPRPEPLVAMNESTARLYPNVTRCGNDCMVPRPCLFPFTRCKSPLTVMIVYNVNATRPGQPGPVIGYGVTGRPLQNSVSIVGNPDLVLPFKTFTGPFNSGRNITAEVNPSSSYPPAREFLDYTNAPALTYGQKDTAIRIASTSKKFQAYLNGPHGPITARWAYPYSGIVHLSMTAGSATSPEYGLVSVDVDPARGRPGNLSFADWKKYW